jgi:hypothetical protein
MKKISTLLLAAILTATISNAQVYNVTSNKNWSNNYPISCNNCTFNISDGVTLTIDRNISLQNPTFKGGNVVVSDNTITLSTGSGGQSKFNNTKFVLNNTSRITGGAPIVITNSTLTFKATSRFMPQQTLEMVSSRLNFYQDSYMQATGSSVNLKNNSLIVAGDGSLSSDAYLRFFGPQLSLYDNSAIIVANNNNHYYNLLSYYIGASIGKWNFTLFNQSNCGGVYPNDCEMLYVFGPVNIMPSGVVAGNSLPVVLSEFSVDLRNNQTELSWITDQESNSSHFEIERSADGTNWTKITSIAAKGNSSVQSKYAFTDRSPVSGINYYRLKMVDMDNSFDYSEVKSVRAAFTANMKVYPNPASNFVHVSLTANASVVRLLNTAGQVLQDRKLVGDAATTSFDISSYTAGTYMIQVLGTDGSSRSNVLLIAK